jgi:hypothetical protein
MRTSLATLVLLASVSHALADKSVQFNVSPGSYHAGGFGELPPQDQNLKVIFYGQSSMMPYSGVQNMGGGVGWFPTYQNGGGSFTHTHTGSAVTEYDFGWLNGWGFHNYMMFGGPWSAMIANIRFYHDPLPAPPDTQVHEYEEDEMIMQAGQTAGLAIQLYSNTGGQVSFPYTSGGVTVERFDPASMTWVPMTGAITIASASQLPSFRVVTGAGFTGGGSVTVAFQPTGAAYDTQDVLEVNEPQPDYWVEEIIVDGGITAVADGPNATEFQNFSAAVREEGEAFFKAKVVDAAGDPLSEAELDAIDPNLVIWTGGEPVGDEQLRRRIAKGVTARTIMTARTPEQPANEAAEMRAYIVWVNHTGFRPRAGMNPDEAFPDFCDNDLNSDARAHLGETGRFGPFQDGRFWSQVQIEFTVAPAELIADGDGELFAQGDFEWDVKRDARPLRLKLDEDTNEWEQIPGHFYNEWSNDDLTETDDDVNPWDDLPASQRQPPGSEPECPGGGHLYDMDWPGNETGGLQDHVAALFYDNFRQFVHVKIGGGTST